MAESNGSNERESRTLIGLAAGAQFLGVKERKFWSLVSCNAVPHHRYGRRYLFLPDELLAWVEAGCPEEPGSAGMVRTGMHR